MVSEVQVLTSSYEPQYGTTTGGEIMVTTRSGTDQFHGGVFEYLRNRDLNALQFTNQRPGGDARPKDNENEFGGFIGGLVKLKFLPFIWGSQTQDLLFPRSGVSAQQRRYDSPRSLHPVSAGTHG